MKKHSRRLARLLAIVVLSVIVAGGASFAARAQAATYGLDGWLWSSNIGWISASSSDSGAGGGPYNVTMDVSGNLTGYMWSSNIGWIKFGGLSNFPTNGTPYGNAAVNLSTGLVTGWARALAGCQNDLWNGTNCTGGGPGNANGVTITTTTGGSGTTNLINNGSFEAANTASAYYWGAWPSGSGFYSFEQGNSTAINNWTVIESPTNPNPSSSIDWVNSSGTAEDGSYSLDLIGSNPYNGYGGVQQTIATVPGHTYSVTFYLAGNPGYTNVSTLEVTAAGQSQMFTFDTTGHTVTSMGWVKETWSFVANSSNTTMQFYTEASTGLPGSAGPMLDNVSVYDTTTTSTSSSTNTGWDGWIELSGTNHANSSAGGLGGVTFIPLSGTFTGYAWGSDVVGWVNFNGLSLSNWNPSAQGLGLSASPNPVTLTTNTSGTGSTQSTVTVTAYANGVASSTSPLTGSLSATLSGAPAGVAVNVSPNHSTNSNLAAVILADNGTVPTGVTSGLSTVNLAATYPDLSTLTINATGVPNGTYNFYANVSATWVVSGQPQSTTLSIPITLIAGGPSVTCTSSVTGSQVTLTATPVGFGSGISYAWANSGGNGTHPNPYVYSPASGTYTPTVTVTDSGGDVASGSCPTITVGSPTAVCPTPLISSNLQYTGGTVPTGNASAYGGSGGPYTYNWSNGSLWSGYSSSPSVTLSYGQNNSSVLQSYNPIIQVKDSSGTPSIAQSCGTVTVAGASNPVAMPELWAGSSLTPPANISFATSSINPNMVLTNVPIVSTVRIGASPTVSYTYPTGSLSLCSGSIASINNGGYSASWTPLTAVPSSYSFPTNLPQGVYTVNYYCNKSGGVSYSNSNPIMAALHNLFASGNQNIYSNSVEIDVTNSTVQEQ